MDATSLRHEAEEDSRVRNMLGDKARTDMDAEQDVATDGCWDVVRDGGEDLGGERKRSDKFSAPEAQSLGKGHGKGEGTRNKRETDTREEINVSGQQTYTKREGGEFVDDGNQQGRPINKRRIREWWGRQEEQQGEGGGECTSLIEAARKGGSGADASARRDTPSGSAAGEAVALTATGAPVAVPAAVQEEAPLEGAGTAPEYGDSTRPETAPVSAAVAAAAAAEGVGRGERSTVAAEEGSGGPQPWPAFEKFGTVQTILDHNRLLIHEIKHNHETRNPDGLVRNAALIRELNSNVAKVVDLYADISEAFVETFGTSPL